MKNKYYLLKDRNDSNNNIILKSDASADTLNDILFHVKSLNDYSYEDLCECLDGVAEVLEIQDILFW